MDLATVDTLLTTTRSVRQRLDLSRAVEPDLIQASKRLTHMFSSFITRMRNARRDGRCESRLAMSD